MRDLDLALGVLVYRERIDHAHRVALLQALQFGDDVAVELWVLEAEHDELNRPDGHGPSSSIVSYDPDGARFSAHRTNRMRTARSGGTILDTDHGVPRRLSGSSPCR